MDSQPTIPIYSIQLIPTGEVREAETVSNSNDVARIAYEIIGKSLQEQVITICMDGSNRIRAIVPTSMGSTDRAFCVPADILRAALMSGCKRFIVAHNHPGGDSNPSSYDDTVTKSINDGATLIGLDMLDHIIVTPQKEVRYSYKEESRI